MLEIITWGLSYWHGNDGIDQGRNISRLPDAPWRKTHVKQECVIAPMLFLIFLSVMLENMPNSHLLGRQFIQPCLSAISQKRWWNALESFCMHKTSQLSCFSWFHPIILGVRARHQRLLPAATTRHDTKPDVCLNGGALTEVQIFHYLTQPLRWVRNWMLS